MKAKIKLTKELEQQILKAQIEQFAIILTELGFIFKRNEQTNDYYFKQQKGNTQLFANHETYYRYSKMTTDKWENLKSFAKYDLYTILNYTNFPYSMQFIKKTINYILSLDHKPTFTTSSKSNISELLHTEHIVKVEDLLTPLHNYPFFPKDFSDMLRNLGYSVRNSGNCLTKTNHYKNIEIKKDKTSTNIMYPPIVNYVAEISTNNQWVLFNKDHAEPLLKIARLYKLHYGVYYASIVNALFFLGRQDGTINFDDDIEE